MDHIRWVVPGGVSRWVMVGGLLLAASLGLSRYGSQAQSDPAVTAAVLTVPTLTAEQVDAYTVARVYTGEVAAGRSSELGVEQSGELVWLGIDRGDWVNQGQPLARIDTRRLQAQQQQIQAQRQQAIAQLQELQTGPRTEVIAAARARVQEIEQQLALEQLRQSRRAYLQAEGAISQEQLDEVAFGANALEDRLQQARSQLSELLAGSRPEQVAAQQAVVAQLDAQLNDLAIAIDQSTLYAPFSGVIAARYLDEGSVIESGRPVFRLVETGQAEIEVGVPAAIAASLRPGLPQMVYIQDQPYQATLVSVLPEVDPVTRTRSLVLNLDTAGLGEIASGQVARLELMQTIDEAGYWLPITALTEGDRGLWVCYATVSDGPDSETYRVEPRQVELLEQQGDRAFVRGLLQDGDQIIASGLHRVVPGQQVIAGQVTEDLEN